jgi:UDP-glucose 4-epimerase
MDICTASQFISESPVKPNASLDPFIEIKGGKKNADMVFKTILLIQLSRECMNTVLVTGGAGYIGSHACKYMHSKGCRPVVADNLVCGHREAIRWGPFWEGSIADSDFLNRIFKEFNIVAVMHFAAFCNVGESMRRPDKYYDNNVVNTLKLLDAMVKNGVSKLVFSSSCATYGEPLELPIMEEHPQRPINPYGKSKLMVEDILCDYHYSFGLNYVSLRYFNAAGADPEGELGEDHRPETHLIPLLLHSVQGTDTTFLINGDDYPTPDGTCVRDYIHVQDLAQAHFLALNYLLSDAGSGVFNLGNGTGYSIREVIKTVETVAGKAVPHQIAKRRPGDPAILLGSNEKAKRELGWRPQFTDLREIITTAWRWHSSHPAGY